MKSNLFSSLQIVITYPKYPAQTLVVHWIYSIRGPYWGYFWIAKWDYFSSWRQNPVSGRRTSAEGCMGCQALEIESRVQIDEDWCGTPCLFCLYGMLWNATDPAGLAFRLACGAGGSWQSHAGSDLFIGFKSTGISGMADQWPGAAGTTSANPHGCRLRCQLKNFLDRVFRCEKYGQVMGKSSKISKSGINLFLGGLGETLRLSADFTSSTHWLIHLQLCNCQGRQTVHSLKANYTDAMVADKKVVALFLVFYLQGCQHQQTCISMGWKVGIHSSSISLWQRRDLSDPMKKLLNDSVYQIVSSLQTNSQQHDDLNEIHQRTVLTWG